ncbi:hypothetical protein JEQ12_014532 [Ovis aries]|uniref:Uncharacterized protein n=1 Tax=Ovis aries TaxID=9940 RepID=A0A836AKK3_SHEEP|nr:hypothetical protein JEQ12_014532 [Ovis aries]
MLQGAEPRPPALRAAAASPRYTSATERHGVGPRPSRGRRRALREQLRGCSLQQFFLKLPLKISVIGELELETSRMMPYSVIRRKSDEQSLIDYYSYCWKGFSFLVRDLIPSDINFGENELRPYYEIPLDFFSCLLLFAIRHEKTDSLCQQPLTYD